MTAPNGHEAPKPEGAQLLAVAYACKELQAEGKQACWHWNRCGCCVSVHEDLPAGKVVYGYVINRHGQAFWEECE